MVEGRGSHNCCIWVDTIEQCYRLKLMYTVH